MGTLTFLHFFFHIFFRKVDCGLHIVYYLYEGRLRFLCIGYDYTACMDYMDPDVRCPQNAVKLNHSFTHLGLFPRGQWHMVGTNPTMTPA